MRNYRIEVTYWLLFLFCITAILTINYFTVPTFLVALLCFSSVIVSALLISWGAEAAQFIISQGLAVAIIALLQVLPEFMVEAVIAWNAGKDPKYITLMLANMTGSNRLLMGVGWTLIFFTTYVYSKLKSRKTVKHIELRRENVFEVLTLFISSAYFVYIVLKKSITIGDGAILGVFFLIYMSLLQKLPPESEERKEDLIALPRYVVNTPGKFERNLKILGLFLVGGLVMYAVAEPFLYSMEHVAVAFGISSFVFVQWVAPFLTEFPEKVNAFYWSRTIHLAPMALLNMISSKVNQWTLLIAVIPVMYSFSSGRIMAVPLDIHHQEEVLLSILMTFYGCAVLLKRKFTRGNAVVMFTLWFIQFIYPTHIRFLPELPFIGNNSRLLTSLGFVIFTIIEIALHYKEVHFIQDLHYSFDLVRGQKEKRKASRKT
jgi:cation:H+ antiporter